MVKHTDSPLRTPCISKKNLWDDLSSEISETNETLQSHRYDIEMDERVIRSVLKKLINNKLYGKVIVKQALVRSVDIQVILKSWMPFLYVKLSEVRVWPERTIVLPERLIKLKNTKHNKKVNK